MRMMLDENISPSLVKPLWDIGVDSIHVHHRKLTSATDSRVWAYAQKEQRAVVTIDEIDFGKLALNSDDHFGVVSIPSGGNRDQQLQYVTAAATWARGRNAIMPGFRNWFVWVESDCSVKAETFNPENDNVEAAETPAAG